LTRMAGSLGSERGSRLEVGLGLLDLTDEAGDLRVGVGGRPAGPLEEDDPAELLLQVADALLGLRVVDLLLTGGNPFLGLLTGLPGGILGLVEEAHLFSLSRCEPGYPARRRSFAGGLRRPPPLVPSRQCPRRRRGGLSGRRRQGHRAGARCVLGRGRPGLPGDPPADRAASRLRIVPIRGVRPPGGTVAGERREPSLSLLFPLRS